MLLCTGHLPSHVWLSWLHGNFAAKSVVPPCGTLSSSSAEVTGCLHALDAQGQPRPAAETLSVANVMAPQQTAASGTAARQAQRPAACALSAAE